MTHCSRLKLKSLSQMLFILLIYSIYAEAQRKQHICQYDELRKDDITFKEIEEIKASEEESKEDEENISLVLSADTLSDEEQHTTLSVKISYLNLDDGTKHCNADKGKIKDAKDQEYQCTDIDILTDEKKNTIKKILEKAVEMHTSRLQVKKLKNGFKVPTFTGNGFCSRLTIPDGDKTTGILDADLVLYVSAAPFKDKPNYAYGFPCAIDKITKRPLVGGIVVDVSKIDDSDYSTRVLAHEIGHILGFDLDIIEKKIAIVKKKEVRTKPDVNEFRGPKVIEKVKEHYNCADATGMEVEDQKKYGRTEWRGSLWESRNAKDELMAGIVRKGLYTYFTLAFFEDLGFYKPDYSKAEHMDWGYKMGCEFLTKQCIENGISNFPTMFCTEENKEKLFCTSGGRKMGTCVGFNKNNNEHVPTFYNYFGNTQWTGLSYLLTDHCPYIEEKEEADCQGSEKSPKLPGKKGPNSWCIRMIDEQTRSVSDGQSGMCAEKKEDSENGISFTFSDKWKPIICNTQQSDTMRDENSINNAKYYCSKPEEIPKKEEKDKESVSLKTTSEDKKDNHLAQNPKTNGRLKSNKEATQSGENPIDAINTEKTKSSESLEKTTDILINETIKKTHEGKQNNANSATLIKTGVTLFFFAVLATY